jgi:hypothetical protein
MLGLPDISRLTLHAVHTLHTRLTPNVAPVDGAYVLPSVELSAQDVRDALKHFVNMYKNFYDDCMKFRAKTADEMSEFQRRCKAELEEVQNWIYRPENWETATADELRIIEEAKTLWRQANALRRWIGLQAYVKEIGDKLRYVRKQPPRFDPDRRSALHKFVEEMRSGLLFYTSVTMHSSTHHYGQEYEELRKTANEERLRAVDQLASITRLASLYRSDFNSAANDANDAIAASRAEAAAAAGGARGADSTNRPKLVSDLLPRPMQVVHEQLRAVISAAKDEAKSSPEPGAVVASTRLDLQMARLGAFRVMARRRSNDSKSQVDFYVGYMDMQGQDISVAKSGIPVEWRWSRMLRSDDEIKVFLHWLWDSQLTDDDKKAAMTWSLSRPAAQ